MDNLTQRIIRLREARNVSKAEMSRVLELDPSNYSKYEKTGRDWTINQLEKIADALGLSVVELLTGEPQKTHDSLRVKELEKRVEELEDRVKDKELIIKGIRHDLKDWFNDFVVEVAEKYGIGRIVFFDTETNEVLETYDTDDETAFKSSIWSKRRFEVPSTIDFRIDFTEEEKKEIATIMTTHPDYLYLRGFFVNEFVGDETMQKVYGYRYRFGKNN
jgi:transcriptional regulator with XRE-family HTH domain